MGRLVVMAAALVGCAGPDLAIVPLSNHAPIDETWVFQRGNERWTLSSAVQAELECEWDEIDLHPAHARMRQGCVPETARWTYPGVRVRVLLCESMAAGPRPLVFARGHAIEEVAATCEQHGGCVDTITIHIGYREL
jgi:hypothetical protein